MGDWITQVLNWFLGILITGIVGIGIFIMVMESKYKHKVTIKKVVKGNIQIKHDKFKVKKDKEGIVWWHFRKLKMDVTPFPNECVGLDEKGRMYGQCYQLSDVTIVPIKDTFDPSEETTYDEIIAKLQPYTSNQRALLVNQHSKAERNRKKTVAEMISAAIPYISVVMIVIMFMIFYGDAVEPIKEMAQTSVAHWETVTENIAQATSQLNEIINNKQVLIGETINQTSNPPPN